MVGAKSGNWPHLRVWVYVDREGQTRVSLDPVPGVHHLSVELPRDPEQLLRFVRSSRGALRDLTGMEDPEEARRFLQEYVSVLRDEELAAAKREQQSGWRNAPLARSDRVGERSQSIRTVSGGLPTLGRRRR